MIRIIGEHFAIPIYLLDDRPGGAAFFFFAWAIRARAVSDYQQLPRLRLGYLFENPLSDFRSVEDYESDRSV